MNEYKYIYENPLDQGYKQFKLTKKQHNTLFKYRQIKWYDKYEYYYNDNEIILHRFTNIYAIILGTILFPIAILLEGIVNIKDTCRDYKRMCNQKKYGSFSGDNIWRDSELYKQITNIINNSKK